jgi:hypothetical protein
LHRPDGSSHDLYSPDGYSVLEGYGIEKSGYTEAKAALEKIFRQLEQINPSAARSLEEGLEETLTVHRLGVGVLRRKLGP